MEEKSFDSIKMVGADLRNLGYLREIITFLPAAQTENVSSIFTCESCIIDFAKTDMLIWAARLARQPFTRIQQA